MVCLGGTAVQATLVFHMQQTHEQLQRLAGRQRKACGSAPQGTWSKHVQPKYDAARASGLSHHQAMSQRGEGTVLASMLAAIANVAAMQPARQDSVNRKVGRQQEKEEEEEDQRKEQRRQQV
jgi:hypothetical protein